LMAAARRQRLRASERILRLLGESIEIHTHPLSVDSLGVSKKLKADRRAARYDATRIWTRR
jgi:hypothetical protein